jgi:DNA-binding MarR family transcriptional regulator
MNPYEEFYELIFGYVKRIAFPEEWLAVDIVMSKQELFTMMTVDRLKEATMSQLSENMNFPMSTATGIVDRLVKKGYVQRGKSESDRRIVIISPTQEGNRFAQNMKAMFLTYIKRAYDALNGEERETLFRIVDKITDSFRRMNAENERGVKERTVIRKIDIE